MFAHLLLFITGMDGCRVVMLVNTPECPLMMGSEAGTLATMTYCVRRRRHRTRHQQPDMPVMCCYKIITVKFYVVMELC